MRWSGRATSGIRAGALAMLLPMVPDLVRAQATAPTDSVLRRAVRLVNEGNGVAGRTLLDSVLAATPTGAPRYPEALFWRAALGESAARAEQDYQRISTEHALSPWSGLLATWMRGRALIK